MISQVQVINKILQAKDYSIISLNNLDDTYFFNYQAEFQYIKNHYETYGQVPDKLTFLNIFPEFPIQETNEPDSFLLTQLYSDYNDAYLANCFNKIKNLLESRKSDEAKEYFKSAVEGLKQGNVLTCTNIFTDLSRYDRYEERTVDCNKYYLSTGFPELDSLIGGIDRENEDMCIIARPGVGKTQLLLKIATTASIHGLTVGIYEGEMTVDKVAYRIDTFLSHIKNSSINRGDLYVQKEYKAYIESLKNTTYGPIKVLTQADVPGGVVTVNTLKAFIEREKLDILFIDQYSLLDDPAKTRTEFEKIGNIAKAIKSLQVEKHIPIISVSQMNRSKNENGEQDTTQVAGSDKIPQYATTVIALEQKLNEDSDIHNRTVLLTLNIIKARDGGDHTKLNYCVNFNTGRFDYIPSAGDNVATETDFNEMEKSYEVSNETNIF